MGGQLRGVCNACASTSILGGSGCSSSPFLGLGAENISLWSTRSLRLHGAGEVRGATRGSAARAAVAAPEKLGPVQIVNRQNSAALVFVLQKAKTFGLSRFGVAAQVDVDNLQRSGRGGVRWSGRCEVEWELE